MSFSTLFFIFTWLPIVYFLYHFIPTRFKNIYLVIISLLFYSWGSPYYTILLIICILFNYISAIKMDQKQTRARKECLIFNMIVNVFILVYFKYYGFFLDTLFDLLPFSIAYRVPDMPLGISFFTFQVIAYQIDVYRKTAKAQRQLTKFSLFVSFFPKLIMGPLTPYVEIEKQMDSHPTSLSKLDQGAKRLIIGLGQKVILANTFAMIWQACQSETTSAFGAWLGIIAFTLQIYFDFNGYTHMAIGIANMFGFQLSENFHQPYRATSIHDFWRRWHISLSLWFRNYVYIPLGGNRVSKLKHIRNLFIVWSLTGFWHGANFTFIIWGCYYGILLVLEKYVWHSIQEKLPTALNWFITIVLIMIGWVFFASSSLSDAIAYLERMFHFTNLMDASTYWYFKSYFIYFVIGILSCTSIMRRIFDALCTRYKTNYQTLETAIFILLFAISICYMVNDTYTSFLYFNF